MDLLSNNMSNKNTDWARHYDYYEVEMRYVYQTVSKPQNDSHFMMLETQGKKYLQREKIFCEIGFSAGITFRHAMKYFDKVYGLDISPRNVEFTAIELKNEGYKNFELFTSDLMEYDNRFANKFDIISFIHGLEHFTNADYPVILNNIKKYLKPGGIFTGAFPYKNGFYYRMCPKCNNVFEIDGHVSSHDLDSLRKVFVDNGFEIGYLNNFNRNYYLHTQGFIKYLYKRYQSAVTNKPLIDQIEFIVKSK